MVDIQSATAEIRRGKEEEDRYRPIDRYIEKTTGENIMACPIT